MAVPILNILAPLAPPHPSTLGGLVRTLSCIVIDALLLLGAVVAALLIRAAEGRWGGPGWDPLLLERPQTLFYFGTVLIWLAALFYEGAYTAGMSALDRTDRILKALSAGLAATLILSVLLHATALILRSVLLAAYAIAMLTFTLLRPALVQRFGLALRHAQLFGTGPRATLTARALQRAGIVTHPATEIELPEMRLSKTGLQPSAAVAICRTGDDPGWQLSALEAHFDEIALIPAIPGLAAMGASAINLHGLQAYLIVHPLRRPLNRGLKRCMDVVLAACLLLLLLPLLGVLSVMVTLTSPGPVFFAHPRLGRDERSFRLWKFRTMFCDAEARLDDLLRHDAVRHAEFLRDFKLKNDPRVTPLGRWLRRFSLDELPQLWNVLRGDMSLVGPRPIIAAEVPRYGDVFPVISSVRPGVTGLWQISGRNEISYDCRPGFDLEYVRGWSFWRDIAILARTIQALVAPNPY
ncbi:MAG: exopolysaccharide biosynthesis polyprenyl glycosylphosphotransferase [Terriglobales bacterium]